jgi:hypothetical protein
LVAAAAGLGGCDQLDTSRTVETYATFGDAVYRESCQRVAYTGQLDQLKAGQINKVDVSGALGRSVCVDGVAPDAGAPPQLSAIFADKSKLVPLVNTILPGEDQNPPPEEVDQGLPFLTRLESFLESMLPTADDGVMQHAVDSLSNVLRTMRDDPDFPTALSRLALRIGYRPTKTAAGLIHTLANYPNIDPLITTQLRLIAPGGSAEAEWKQVLAAASRELSYAQPVANPRDPERTLQLALNLLTTTNPDLGSGKPRPLTLRDYRGVARATVLSGKLVAPFVDLDNDGLADVDAQGRFVDAQGNPLSLPSPFPDLGATDTAPRDQQGRALTAANATTTIYQFFDLDNTVLAGLAREAFQLVDPKKDIMLGLAWGASALLGPRAPQMKMYMDSATGRSEVYQFNGFDATKAPVLDLAHAFVQVLGDPDIDLTLQTTSTLLSQHEALTARAVAAMLNASDRAKNYPNAVIPQTSVLFDELVPLIVRVLRVPGLFEDLIQALNDPNTKDLAPIMANQMIAANQIDFDHTNGPAYPLKTSGPNAPTPIVPVDHNQPDVGYNRSILQRTAHIVHDTNGWKYCNKANWQIKDPLTGLITVASGQNACELFEIDDVALFYMLNMASANARNANPSAKNGADFCAHITLKGNLAVNQTTCPALIGSLIKISGFGQFPTPQALNRQLFLSDNEKPQGLKDTATDLFCSDNDDAIEAHNYSLVAWEAPFPNAPSGNPNATFYTAMQPVVDAFAKHDECLQFDANMNCVKSQNAAKILLDLFSVLHEHWASQNAAYGTQNHTFQSTTKGAPRFSYGDNLRSYEPLLADVLGLTGDLVPSVIALAPTLQTLTVDGTSNGQPALPVLKATATYLFDPAATPTGLAYRDGSTSTLMSDGKTVVPRATPYYLLADAYAHKRTALAAAPGMQSDKWKSSTSALVDQFLTVDKGNNTWQFHNRRFRAISLIVIDFLRSRIAAHTKAGDLDTWVHHTLTSNLTDVFASPLFAAFSDFTGKVETDVPPAGQNPAPTELYNLLGYLIDEATNDTVFQTALTTLADQTQLFLDDPNLIPVARMLGAALDPTTGTVDAQLVLFKRAHESDAQLTANQAQNGSNKTLYTVMRSILVNLYRQDPQTGIYPASQLADVLSDINRAQPGQTGPLSGDDYKTILDELQAFFGDQQHGFARFVNIVKSRNGNR